MERQTPLCLTAAVSAKNVCITSYWYETIFHYHYLDIKWLQTVATRHYASMCNNMFRNYWIRGWVWYEEFCGSRRDNVFYPPRPTAKIFLTSAIYAYLDLFRVPLQSFKIFVCSSAFLGNAVMFILGDIPQIAVANGGQCPTFREEKN